MTTVVRRLRAIPTWQVTLGIALLALGFLIAAQLSAQGPRIRYTTQERTPLVETATELQRQQDDLRRRVTELREAIAKLEEQGVGTTQIVRELNSELEEARIAAGLIPLEGTGIVFQLKDSSLPVPEGADESDYLVTARDIRTVIAELWLAGAEAISVNGERVTVSTGVLDIGHTILVNSAYLSPPYEIRAIGPTDILDQLGLSEGWRDFIQTRRGTFGLDIAFAEPPVVAVPAFAGSLTLRESRAVPSPSPTPAAP
ncbi:MAG TPA: DUF881 domain-containing protein [Candidatus Limnocylindrales bacterium]|nr:DUF881 domain-containing protein [Candidatus Limnocylindrales bacterium]